MLEQYIHLQELVQDAQNRAQILSQRFHEIGNRIGSGAILSTEEVHGLLTQYEPLRETYYTIVHQLDEAEAVFAEDQQPTLTALSQAVDQMIAAYNDEVLQKARKTLKLVSKITSADENFANAFNAVKADAADVLAQISDLSSVQWTPELEHTTNVSAQLIKLIEGSREDVASSYFALRDLGVSDTVVMGLMMNAYEVADEIEDDNVLPAPQPPQDTNSAAEQAEEEHIKAANSATSTRRHTTDEVSENSAPVDVVANVSRFARPAQTKTPNARHVVSSCYGVLGSRLQGFLASNVCATPPQGMIPSRDSVDHTKTDFGIAFARACSCAPVTAEIYLPILSYWGAATKEQLIWFTGLTTEMGKASEKHDLGLCEDQAEACQNGLMARYDMGTTDVYVPTAFTREHLPAADIITRYADRMAYFPGPFPLVAAQELASEQIKHYLERNDTLLTYLHWVKVHFGPEAVAQAVTSFRRHKYRDAISLPAQFGAEVVELDRLHKPISEQREKTVLYVDESSRICELAACMEQGEYPDGSYRLVDADGVLLQLQNRRWNVCRLPSSACSGSSDRPTITLAPEIRRAILNNAYDGRKVHDTQNVETSDLTDSKTSGSAEIDGVGFQADPDTDTSAIQREEKISAASDDDALYEAVSAQPESTEYEVPEAICGDAHTESMANEPGLAMAADVQADDSARAALSDATSSRELAQSILRSNPEALDAEHFKFLLDALLHEDRVTEATVLAQAAAISGVPGASVIFEEIAYATNSSLVADKAYDRHVIAPNTDAVCTNAPERLRPILQASRAAELLWLYMYPESEHSLRSHQTRPIDNEVTSDNPYLKVETFRNLLYLMACMSANAHQGRGIGTMRIRPAGVARSLSAIQKQTRDRQRKRNASMKKLARRAPVLSTWATGEKSDVTRWLIEIATLSDSQSDHVQNVADEIQHFLDQVSDGGASGSLSTRKLVCLINENAEQNQAKNSRDALLDEKSETARALIEWFQPEYEILQQWLCWFTDLHLQSEDKQAMLSAKEHNELLTQLSNAEKELRSNAARRTELSAGYALLREAVHRVQQALKHGREASKHEFIPLLQTGHFWLDENHRPAMPEEAEMVHGFQAWHRILRHIAAEPMEISDFVKQATADRSSLIYGDYGIADTLCEAACEKLSDHFADFDSALDGQSTRFEHESERLRGELRCALMIGKIDDDDGETIANQISALGAIFKDQRNLGLYRRLVDVLIARIKRIAGKRRCELEAGFSKYVTQISSKEPDCANTPIADAFKSALEADYLERAAELLRRIQSGVRTVDDEEIAPVTSPGHLSVFLKCYDAYADICEDRSRKKTHPSSWIKQAIKTMPTHYTSTTKNQDKSGAELVEKWIKRKKDPQTPELVKSFLSALGFKIRQVRLVKEMDRDPKYEVFSAACTPEQAGLDNYPHPIAAFGTDMGNELNIICMYGGKVASTIEQVLQEELGSAVGPTIILMDGVLKIENRCRLASYAKAETNGQSPFLLIDRLLLLYMASVDDGERRRALLECGLPLTYLQPYSNGAGFVTDEMFFGRREERNAIGAPNGPCLVYGGRQLGKSALLHRVCSVNHQPGKKWYAIMLDIKDKSSKEVLSALKDELSKSAFAISTGRGKKKPRFQTCRSFEELCRAIKSAIDTGLIQRLQIYLDEADALFQEAAADNYELLRPMVNLMKASDHQVKFVFAGLHNVASSQNAHTKNSPILQMGQPQVIAPLSALDAAELLTRPLRYLGYTIEPDVLARLLESSNHYPGLLHIIGRSLVEKVRENARVSTGDSRDNLPYPITLEYITNVLRKVNLRERIDERMRATINGVSEEYRILALVIAHLHYADSKGSRMYCGFTSKEIYDAGELLLKPLSEQDVKSLLDEMRDMGILYNNTENGTYRIRKRDYLRVVGSAVEVQKEVEKPVVDAVTATPDHCLVANALTYLHYTEIGDMEDWISDGHTAKAVHTLNRRLESLSKEKIEQILDDLVGSGVAARDARSGRYVIRNRAYARAIGDADAVLRLLDETDSAD